MNTEKQMSLYFLFIYFFLTEDKWQFIKVRQPLNLQSCGTPEEMLPVEMVNFKARTQNFHLPVHAIAATDISEDKWSWNKHKENHRKKEAACFERKRRTGHTRHQNEGQTLHKKYCTKYSMGGCAPRRKWQCEPTTGKRNWHKLLS